MSSSSTWIYHERQDALLCGQHALNNLLQSQAFTASDLATVAQQLDAMELNFMSDNNEGGIHSRDFIRRVAEGSGNVDMSGNFSIEVLRSALLERFGLTLTNIRHEDIRGVVEITELDGFICNRENHWFAIRKIGDRFWNLNSTLETPEWISHFRLAAEVDALQASGYSVFCVVEVGKLPPPCKDETERDMRGPVQFWWREADLGKGSGGKKGGGGGGSGNAANVVDPWKNVGTGMRLDGKSGIASAGGSGKGSHSIDGLTEEEMLQMALSASMAPENNRSSSTTLPDTAETGVATLSPEPPIDDKNALRLRFRLPDGRVVERRFLRSEPVDVLYVFVAESCSMGKQQLVLKAGYPLKDIRGMCVDGKTIGEGNLSGELIHCRQG